MTWWQALLLWLAAGMVVGSLLGGWLRRCDVLAASMGPVSPKQIDCVTGIRFGKEKQ